MLKTRQKNLRIFEFETTGSEQEYLAFLSKNLPILKAFCLVFNEEIPASVEAFLRQNEIKFLTQNGVVFNAETRKDFNVESSIKSRLDYSAESNTDSNTDSTKTLILNRIIRSGEVVEHLGDLVLLNQVNSGARVIAQNITALAKMDGVLENRGEVLILGSEAVKSLKNSREGKILLKSHIISGEFLGQDSNKSDKSGAKLVTIVDNKPQIKDI